MNAPPGWRPNPYDAPPGGAFGAPNYMPPGPYGIAPQPYGPAPYQNSQASGTAVAALVLAILSWIATSCLTSIPGFLLARSELAAIDRGQSSPAGRGLAQAAYWISLAHLILMALVIALVGVLFAVGAIH